MSKEAIKLSYQGLADQAKVINGYKEEFNTLLGRIMTTTDNLTEVWDDRAAHDFIDKVRGMKPTFDKFSEALDGLSIHMKNVSDKYIELQSAIISSQKF
ncbi:WXG100 family type VII secretion target [Paenibacillus septentrionalis]|uniref:WXG100 family type VII secretion target n=1 Tax=Paenibacillus septentrionalis TaxID=429342 RepID=A0ABW1V625_9BACL